MSDEQRTNMNDEETEVEGHVRWANDEATDEADENEVEGHMHTANARVDARTDARVD